MTLMDCDRAEELFSDHLEDTLGPPLLDDLAAHLRACARCRELRAALAEVVEALRSAPMLEPPAGLARRAAEAALRRPRLVTAPPRPQAMPAWLQAVAAVLALAVTGLTLLAAAPAEGGATRTSKLKQQTVNLGVYLVERKERLVEDLRLLRVVVSTAFEGRLDRVEDRVDDYRRLLEKRRAAEQDGKKTNYMLPNREAPRLVTVDERRQTNSRGDARSL